MLRLPDADWLDEEGLRVTAQLVRMVPQAAAEITRLRARLEVMPEWPESADGIACRDETIRLQDARIASLRAELAEARAGGSL